MFPLKQIETQNRSTKENKHYEEREEDERDKEIFNNSFGENGRDKAEKAEIKKEWEIFIWFR